MDANSVQDATIAHYSGYTEQEIQPVFKLMVDYLHKPVVHEAFFKKYASKKFLKGWSHTNPPPNYRADKRSVNSHPSVGKTKLSNVSAKRG